MVQRQVIGVLVITKWHKDMSRRDLFEQLNRHGIRVVSMRNKANRLEELFLRLVDSKHDPEGGT